MKNWRVEQEAVRHAQRTNTSLQLGAAPLTQHKVLGKVVQDVPFAAAVKLAGSRRLPNAAVKAMVDEISKAASEQEALAVIDAVAVEFPAGGPDNQAVVVNMKAKRMRMVLPQVINLRPPEELYEADKASEDEKMWREVRRVAEGQITYYEQMTPLPLNFTGPTQ